ncbi:hypothetical protein K469DRAFT_701935 [Zopfia rhizophila CBS 207.26]|uniref:Chromo domain-containing protein n=1 Tax=Zopfia rhizophila CBS 207.26 TaxID=1314779 RepID=A0A6A6EE33_9PEZI|nr:hypothetical protein K469DRAFT_701935 [Zopfia rhizophila CBS 207.26]
MYGLYPIIGIKGYFYYLKLLLYMRMFDVFHADRLQKASTRLLPGQIKPEELPIEVNGHPEWPVQEILDSRLFYGRLQYKASWLAYDLDPAWYNARGFIGAPHKLKAYEAEEDLKVTEENDKAALKTRVVQRPARRKL